MICEIEPLREKHVEDAARLFADRFRVERGSSPLLPSRYEGHEAVTPLPGELGKKSPGVVAIRGHKLAGFLIGRLLPSWCGGRTVYAPEWGHSVAGEQRRELFEEMYSRLAPEWNANGCFTHLITILAHDRELTETLFWLGFGMAAVDALRDLSPTGPATAEVEIRRATLDDLDSVATLNAELVRYMAGPPVFWATTERRGREYHEKWLSDPTHVLWLASRQGKAVSCLALSTQAATLAVSDERTAAICRTYTAPTCRREGIAAALLQCSLSWAQAQGHERCAVDFESRNVPAARFRLRYFRPVCYSLARRLDERIAWANQEREDEGSW